MAADLVFGVRIGSAEDLAAALQYLVQFWIGPAYQHARPMLTVGVDVGEKVAQQVFRLAAASRTAEKQFIDETSAYRRLLRPRLRSPGHA